MNVQVLVSVDDDLDADQAIDCATDLITRGFKKSGIEIVFVGREGAIPPEGDEDGR